LDPRSDEGLFKMKFALTGAHGTGKTTLIKRIVDLLSPHLKIVPCREVPKTILGLVGDNFFFRRGRTTPIRQMLIFLQQVIEEHMQAKSSGVLLTDRTLVDHLAYTEVLFPELVTSAEFKVLQAAVRTWLAEYTAIFRLPVEFSLVDDGVRELDPDFQLQIDHTIDRLYSDFGIMPTTVTGTLDVRASTISAMIKRSVV
jgi:predicted ATPase